MSAQGLDVIDHTVQLTHVWINKQRERWGWTSRCDTSRLLRVTLKQNRDHLGHSEAVQLSAQLPLLIRRLFFEGWQPARTPMRDRVGEHFFTAIESEFSQGLNGRGQADVVRVFRTLNNRISEGELHDVKVGLPQSIRDIWPE